MLILLICKLPFSIESALKAGPRAEPEGLFPSGKPPNFMLPPFGTIANWVTFVVVLIIYSTAKSASYF